MQPNSVSEFRCTPKMRRLRKMEYLIKHNFKTELFHMIIKLNNPYISAKMAISSQKNTSLTQAQCRNRVGFFRECFSSISLQ